MPADKHGFYSYEAKYIDADGAALRIPLGAEGLHDVRLEESQLHEDLEPLALVRVGAHGLCAGHLIVLHAEFLGQSLSGDRRENAS